MMITRSIIFGLSIASALFSFCQTKNFIDRPYVETSAFVDTLVTPDEIFLAILITEADTKGKTSVEELESKMESTLKALGIDTKEDLTLTDLASNFKKYFLRSQDILKSKSYQLKVKTAQMAGRAIIALENIEIANVQLSRLEYSEMDKLKLDLKSKAILKAKQQARAMVEPLGQSVGSALHIFDQSNNRLGRFYDARSATVELKSYAAEADYQPADIEFQKIRVESSLSVKFKLNE